MRYVLIGLLLLLSTSACANSKVFSANGLAIGGVDVVSYFEQGKPALGSEEYAFAWEGNTWRFSSEEHLALFKQKPSYYMPQFGGFCTLTTAHKASIPINPMVWEIHEDKLYLFIFESAKETWLMDPQKLIGRAMEYWTQV